LFKSLLIPTFLFVLLSFFLGCADDDRPIVVQEESSPTFLNVDQEVEYVGDLACFDCHEDEYLGFYEHGMSRSMYPLTGEVAVEEYGSETVVDSTTGLRYYTVRSDSGFFMIENLLDSHGEVIHELAREMEYVVGSGTSARTYLTEEDGWFYELPVTWYTQQQKWDFSPGYRVANKRFDRKLADRCVVCHNSYPTPEPQTNGMFVEMPDGIGCERCHGPGSLHVEERLTSSEASGEYDKTIVNPAHLDLDLRLDVCQQCHLNGSVSLLREGRTPYDFRPSQNLADYVALFQAPENVDDDAISVISHADRMRKSACFIVSQSTEQPLECTTCHDPHGGFREEGPSYFNSTCLDCHGDAQLEALNASETLKTHTTEANCVACHMPRTDLIEAPHSAFTDHWIQVVGRDDKVKPLVSHDAAELSPQFDRDRRTDGEARLYEGMAYVTRGYQEGEYDLIRQGIGLLEAAFEDGHSFGEALYLHGYANILLGQYAEAVESLEESVRLEPTKTERLNSLAQAYEQTGRDPVTIERLYREALRIQPLLADIRINLGRFLETRNRMDEAIEEYREVIRTESWNALGYYNLGTAFLRTGDLTAAKSNLEYSLVLEPFNAGALSNLGLIHIRENELSEARQILETAVSRNPEHAAALDNLGSLYLNMELLQEAIEMLTRASVSDSRSADTFAKLGLAYFRSELYDEARLNAERALTLNPTHPLALQIIEGL